MLSTFQKTLSHEVSFTGISLHSGLKTSINLKPANENTGIVFKRIDIDKNNLIEANFKNVVPSKLCTTLKNKFGIKVSTVEHLLAAIYVAGIDNVEIEINNEEVPIMDGSAKDFLIGIGQVGTIEQSKKRKYLKISKKVDLTDENKKISIEPKEDSSLEVDFHLDYKNRVIGKQKNVINFQFNDLKDIVESRTFCLYEDIERIKKLGLAKGGSLDNAIVVGAEKVINDGGLRNDKEFVNHKILDLAGDLLLSGYRILGKITCHHGGHELTNKFLRKLFKSQLSFTIFQIEDIVYSKNLGSKQLSKLAVNA
tara:strand:+ start:2075 stop:3004 length:930 start_codon:yes stop_codon:yes gene_type:complete